MFNDILYSIISILILIIIFLGSLLGNILIDWRSYIVSIVLSLIIYFILKNKNIKRRFIISFIIFLLLIPVSYLLFGQKFSIDGSKLYFKNRLGQVFYKKCTTNISFIYIGGCVNYGYQYLGADSKTFKILTKRCCYNIVQCDNKQYEQCDTGYAKDKNSVFYSRDTVIGQRVNDTIKGIDAQTFEGIGGNLFKDKYGYIYREKRLVDYLYNKLGLLDPAKIELFYYSGYYIVFKYEDKYYEVNTRYMPHGEVSGSTKEYIKLIQPPDLKRFDKEFIDDAYFINKNYLK